jgi:hypothetical protein
MNKMRFNLIAVVLGVALLATLPACSTPSSAADTTCPPPPKSTGAAPSAAVPVGSKPDSVELVYFHKQNPCHCMAVVGDNIRYAVDTYFKEETGSGRLKLTMVVSDDPANAGVVKQYNAMLFALFVREIRGGQDRVYPVDSIWEMTGDDNREKLVQFIKTTVTAVLEGKI